MWWPTPLITELRKQRQMDQPGLHSESQNNQAIQKDTVKKRRKRRRRKRPKINFLGEGRIKQTTHKKEKTKKNSTNVKKKRVLDDPEENMSFNAKFRIVKMKLFTRKIFLKVQIKRKANKYPDECLICSHHLVTSLFVAFKSFDPFE